MIVDLKNIPEQGEEYCFNRESKEVHGFLDDLVKKNPFQVDLKIQPLGNSFQVRGSFESIYQDDCSRCGDETDVPIKGKIYEILMIEEVRPRTAQSNHNLHSGNYSDEGPSVTYIHSSQFDIAAFIHELIAFSMPAYPKCLIRENCKPVIDPSKGQAGDEGHPAFSELKKIKTHH